MANLTNSAKLIEEMEKQVNSSSLATVATSWSYTDLSNKPTIPTVNDSTITVQKNGANVDSFTTNAATWKTINIQLAKADVWLGNVDNTSDANKPISNATQTALNAKADANSVYTKAEVDSAISSAVSSVYKYKGSVANYASLPTTGLTVWDVYNVEDTWDNYAWTGTAWDKLAGTVDLSSYLTKSEASTTYLTQAAASTNYATKTEVQEAVAEVDWISTDQPENPTAWAIYYDSTDSVVKVYNWSEWIEVWAWSEIVFLTQAEYDALTNPDPDICYIIKWSGTAWELTVRWENVLNKPEWLMIEPSTWTAWQVLTKTASGYEYANVPWEIVYITQAWWDALPSSKLTDWKNYVIIEEDS